MFKRPQDLPQEEAQPEFQFDDQERLPGRDYSPQELMPVYAFDEPRKLLRSKAQPADTESKSRVASIVKRIASTSNLGNLRFVNYPLLADFGRLKSLRQSHPNFSQVIDLVQNQIVVALATETRLSIPPILLWGPPGVGKTHFAQELASVLGTGMHDGVVMTLCEEHRAQRRAGGSDALGDFWVFVHPGSWDVSGAQAPLPDGVKVKGTKHPMPKSAAVRAAEHAARAYADDLVQRFPYQFCGPSIKIAVGWKGIFAKLCTTVDDVLGQDKHGFHWIYASEDSGVAILRFELGSHVPADIASELHRKLRAVIAEVESQTSQMCVVCGKHGELDKSQAWGHVLCKQHAAGVGGRPLLVDIPKGKPCPI